MVTALFVFIALVGLFSFLAATTDKPLANFYRGHIDPIHHFWGQRAAKICGLPIFIFGLAVPFPLTPFFLDALGAIVASVFLYGWLSIVGKITEKGNTK